MAFTRVGVRSPSPPLPPSEPDPALNRPLRRGGSGARILTVRGNSSVGRAQPCQGWGRGFESRFPLVQGPTHAPSLVEYRPERFVAEAYGAGWSSLVARRAHNPEVVGSNPTPAMSARQQVSGAAGQKRGGRLVLLSLPLCPAAHLPR